MNPTNWDRVKHVFQAALDRAPHERHARARELCGDDRALLAEVESLLATHQEAGSFAERPAVELLNALSIDPDAQNEISAASALTEGARLGVYEIRSLIGTGGMGEVYEALDTRLNRTVAIKVLRARRGADPRARERFEREARAVAALSHPHICTLHDIGHHDGIDFLVMERLAGETLEARLARGPLRLEQALDMAIQIASALDTAHRAGIVHRDLKPANIFLARSGGASALPTAKLLDFGLAKADDLVLHGAALQMEPTAPLTTPGAIFGTVRYMAPEQLEGKGADVRTDVFAFGAVLSEMITGRRAFDAGSEAGVIAAILEHEPPPLSGLQPPAPALLDRIVRTCLAKDPDERWQTARDLLRALTWARDGEAGTQPASPAARQRNVRIALVWTAAAIAIATLSSVAIYWSRRPALAEAPNISFSVYPPEGTRFPRGAAEMAVSSDGSRLVFAARSADGTRRLWIREFDAVTARRLDGTDGASTPFWSPDGSSIGFFADSRLKRIPERGGVPQVLCETPGFQSGGGGTWNREGTILFGAFNGPIRAVADTGGVATSVTTLDASREEHNHTWPVFLPDGQRFLYLARSTDRSQTGIYQGSLGSRQTQRVLAAESSVGVLGAHLLLLSNSALIARVYNPDRAEVVGKPITIAEHIQADSPLRSGGPFAAGADSVLAYRSATPDSHLTWLDRTGRQIGSFPTPGDYQHPWLSPDEKQVAIEKTDTVTAKHTIWILDLARGLTSRLLSDPAGAHGPVWSPDGSRVIFGSNRLGGLDLYSIGVDGAGREEPLLGSTEHVPLESADWSLDGRFLLYQPVRRDIWILPMSPPGKGQPFLATPAMECQGQFSPDTRWVAYTSDESGAYEVYVRRFPGADGKWRVSTHGGAQARWRRDGKELFYLAPDGNLMSAAVTNDGSRFETATPRALFNTGITASFIDRRNQYVVTRDGQRFLVNVSAEDENSAPITVVLNWKGTLKK